jgi:hypothetical protein
METKDYNLRFEKLFYKYFEENKLTTDFAYIINIVGEMINQYCLGKRFCIWGAGEHTDRLYNYFSNEIKDALYIVDNNKKLQGSKVLGFQVIASDNISSYPIDVILISSYAGAYKIEEQILSMGIEVEIVNIYRLLNDKGLDLQGAFYDNPGLYIQVYNKIKEYETEKVRYTRDEILQEIIQLYLSIRDILNAKKYIQEYIENQYSRMLLFKDLYEEIDVIINDLTEVLKVRNNDDIMLLLYDSIRAKDIYNNNNMKFFNYLKDTGTWFEKAFSPSIFTYESIPCILSGDAYFNGRVVNAKDSPFIKQAIEKGYSIKIYAIGQWPMFEGEGIKHGEESKYISLTFWNALCDIAKLGEEKILAVLYFWQESHPPHICGVHSVRPQSHNTPFTSNDIIKQTWEEYTTQYKESLRYIDIQTEFYLSIVSDNTIKVLFADHGQVIEEALEPLESMDTKLGWHSDRFHVPLIIHGKGIENICKREMITLADFPKIVVDIINKDRIKKNARNYIEIKFNPIYNNIMIENYGKCGKLDYLHGFKIYCNDHYKIVMTGTQKIKIYDWQEEEKEIEDTTLKDKILIQLETSEGLVVANM